MIGLPALLIAVLQLLGIAFQALDAAEFGFATGAIGLGDNQLAGEFGDLLADLIAPVGLDQPILGAIGGDRGIGGADVRFERGDLLREPFRRAFGSLIAGVEPGHDIGVGDAVGETGRKFRVFRLYAHVDDMGHANQADRHLVA